MQQEMVVEEETSSVYQVHLHKLVGVKSEQELEDLLKLLWQTRKTGLSAPQKASLQTLLNLPSLADLGPVLASLRSLLRNCVQKNIVGDDILKLLPPDLPLELQSMLLILLQKHQNQWKEEQFQEQTRSLHPPAAPLLPFSSLGISGSVLLPEVDQVPHFRSHNLGGGPTSVAAERNVPSFPQLTLQNDVVPPDILGVLPRVKSMTWTVENKNEIPANRVAVITLKLQDYTNCPTKDMEVKFQLTRDTLEAVLRSMSYINDQLSRAVGPLQKKQKH